MLHCVFCQFDFQAEDMAVTFKQRPERGICIGCYSRVQEAEPVTVLKSVRREINSVRD